MIRLAVLFVFLPLAAWSQQVSIRSGEHESYSRLVMGIGDQTSWSIDPIETGYRLRLDGRATGFDYSEVFDRIPADRLLALREASPSQLDLVVECDCHIDAFLWQPGQLVVDIVDGPDPDAAMTAASPPPVRPTPFGDVVQTVTPIVLTETTADVTLSRLPDLLQLEGGLSLVPRPSVQLDQKVEDIPAPADGSPAEIGDAEAVLLESIAIAASQGFLSPNDPLEMTEEEPAPEQHSSAGIPEEDSVFRALDRPGLGISTALERDLQRVGEAIGDSIDRQCLPPEDFDIASWATSEDLHIQIAGLSESLSDEFGQETLEAQTQLARIYIHFGFGAEARTVLAADETTSQSRRVLEELAGLVDEYDEAFPLLESQVGCNSEAALWAMLANPKRLETVEDRNLILQSFFSLPQPLRGYISPRLSSAFLSVGDDDAAEKVLRGIQPEDHDAKSNVQAARADVALSRNDNETALATLRSQARDSARISPETLIEYIDLAISMDAELDASDVLLAAASRMEYRGTEFEEALALAEARGHAYLADFLSALAALPDTESDEVSQQRDQILIDLAETGPVDQFLTFAFGPARPDLSDKTENAIARRLIDLGFPDQALRAMTGTAVRDEASERRFLRAEASLASGGYSEVLEYLAGMNDERAQDLRAKAFEGLGEYRSALTSLDSGAPGSSVDLQFRAEAWDRLSIADDPAIANFASSFLQEPQTPAPDSLSDRRAILERAQNSRQAVEELLSRFDTGEDPPSN